MPYAVLDGPGSYSVAGVKLRPGANELPEDSPVLKALEERPFGRIRIVDTLVVEEAKEPVQEEPEVVVPDEPFVEFQGRDGKHYFIQADGKQSDGYETKDEASAAIEEAQKPTIPTADELEKENKEAQSGTLTADDTKDEHACQIEGCDWVGKSKGSLTNHQRINHPEHFGQGKKKPAGENEAASGGEGADEPE